MKRTIFSLALAGMAMALIAAPVAAQSRGNESSDRRQSSTNQQANRHAQETFSGTVSILKMKKVPIRNSDLEHSVALVRTDDGSQGVIDLGPAEALQDLQLRNGQSITVRGKSVRVGDRRVLMASRITSRGDELQVDRSLQPRERTRRVVLRSDLRAGSQGDRDQQSAQLSSQQGNSRRAGVRGKVEQTKRVEVRNRGVDHLVVLVRTDNGKVRIVDLGPVDNLNQVRFARGDTILADGDVVAVGDRQVLMARRFASENQQQDVQRDSSRNNRSTNQSGQGDRDNRRRGQQ